MATLNLSGCSVLITGAGSGIGKATALRFASAGSKVFLIGRTSSKLEEVIKEINEAFPNVESGYAAVDVCDKSAIEDAVKSAVSKFGGLNIVVANGM